MSEEKTAHVLIRDFFGVVALAFTVFGFMALMTFSSTDPTFNKSVSDGNVINSGGMVGAYLADGLILIFGSGSFFVPVITAVIGWILIRGKESQNWLLILGSGVLFLVGFCSLLAIQFDVDPFFGKVIPVGGLIGDGLGGFLVTWLNPSGAVLTLLTVVFISFMVMTRLEVNTLLKTLGKFFSVGGSALWLVINGIKVVALKTFQALVRIFKGAKTAFENLKAMRSESVKTKYAESDPVIVRRTRPEPLVLERKDKTVQKSKEEKPEFIVQDHFSFMGNSDHYEIPPLTLLNDVPPDLGTDVEKARSEILASSAILEKKLLDFGIEGRVVQVLPGPVITLFEYEPAPGVKVSRIVSLADDLALAMRCVGLRILAPVPGKPVVGIEIPNLRRETIYFKDVMESDAFQQSDSKLNLAIGKDITGEPAVQDLAKTPHLLMAGSTGSGKSVGLNSMICSILLNATPDEVKMIMIDPKMLELSVYDGIPHLIAPVVTNPKKAAAALQWAVTEMETRYKMMAEKGVRNISGFNDLAEKLQKEYEIELKKREKTNTGIKPIDEKNEDQEENLIPEPPAKLPYIVVLIDELADLMMVASKGVEDCLTRLAQMARAAGIHLIVATQRPSVDVLTGIIKTNFPTRMSYKVTSRVDSRTILDAMGADKLLGRGDMLFLPPGSSGLLRLHGVMVSDEEIARIVNFIKKQAKPVYEEDIFQSATIDSKDEEEEQDMDEKYDEALAIVAKDRQASISYIQRRLRIGYNRAARIIETMEREGVVGPSDGVKPREVYVSPIEIE
ncbi:MAG: cell division protein FtsK [Nitrospina sp.]|nr:cell division protein FtsK [Nitrospina sp.]|tara:strand:+ start:678 stop:3041 length:2364 start_codon:yes stop_codon:yes gene_type:complete